MSKAETTSLSKDDMTALKSLAPGTVVDLQIETPTAPQRLKTHYVGMDIPNAFIFQVPNTHKWANIRDYLVAGNEVVVRFVIEGGLGQVIAFKTTILKCFSKPVSILITGFPSKLQTMGLRSDRRSQPGIPVSVYLDQEEQERVRGLIIDVSKTGCKLAIKTGSEDSKLEVNKKITLGCKLDGETIRIDSNVRNVAEVKGYYYYGIQFTNEQKAVETLIERYILAL
ncbi:flagellar brake protein [Alteromonas sp. RKMC-009]|uniref:flagellar brake protein n=1 Tax=Alteromonas sp. RKMC-009 TaxID=2267264 RepID=UPI000C4E685C|nr:flagellar brake protein [Alteromonas sp. RKMC-009]AYA64426.1 flagellar brake protein [Alteromonas sp. RKMC-009]MBT80090.1 flagellar brake protein [Alteromonadaceae bacterium]MEC7690656.1 flagellar brake protein [Pseudomonadota bacterium]